MSSPSAGSLQPSNQDQEAFSKFVRFHGEPAAHQPADREELERRSSVLPARLIEFWRRHGFGRYADGLFWTHPPAIFDALITDWTGFSQTQACFILRTGFGDFCFLRNGTMYLVDVHLGRVDSLGGDVDFFFEYSLCRPQFLRDMFRLDAYEQCRSRLGVPGPEECFAYVPARALGGPGTPETAQRVVMREHLAMLAQILGPLRIP